MEYIWIIILALIYIIWLIAVISDLIECHSTWIFLAAIGCYKSSTWFFIILHLLALFTYSLCLWGGIK